MRIQWPHIPPAAQGRENHFNIMRLGFAVLVLLAHAAELADGNRSREILTQAFGSISFGELGVDGFFVLSGFLITRSWRAEPHPGPFLRKRALRIFPAFWVASLLSALVFGPLGADPRVYFEQLSMLKVLLGMAVLSVPLVPPVFEGSPHARVNQALWTISIEFFCYLLVLVFGWRHAIERRHIWLGFTVLWGVLWAAQRASDLTPWPLPQPFYDLALFRLLLAFFVGGCFELYADRIRFTPARVWAMAGVTLAALFSVRWCELILPISGGYLLFALAFAQSPALAKLRGLPDVSYGTYLYGWPVQKLLYWYWPGLSPWWGFGATVVICLALGALSWYLVEKPCLRLKARAQATRA